MAVVFEKPKSLTDAPFHYCPGCPHGIIHRLVAEVMDELGIEGKARNGKNIGATGTIHLRWHFSSRWTPGTSI